MYQDPEFDKYTFDKEADVDCESRLDTCKAISAVNSLSRCQDTTWKMESSAGVLGRPYLIAHGEDGYCVHLDRKTFKCTVHEHRTIPCRGFDCRNNEQRHFREDYEKKILNPELEERIERDNGKIYSLQTK